ncbi:MAG TPA: hypothetical protein VK966_01450 [Longimicrobiales bacterium]|nr:hypothetical protein [Longimicrobiales bacterium]
MTFMPSAHGWPFANTFDAGGPALGLGTSPGVGFGLGGGMCWSALDRYLDGRTIPETSVPSEGDPLHAELLRRQVAALAGVWERVRAWQSLPDGSWRDRLPGRWPRGRKDVASLTRAGWPRIRRALAGDRPVLLTLVLPADGYARGHAARQVLAYAYERDGAAVTLSVYDPDRPGDDNVRLGFSLSGPLDARLTGGERVRGFFPVLHDRNPAAPLRAETFGDRAVIGLNRKVRGRPSAAVRGRTLHLVARDPDGALLHFSRPRGGHWEGANVTEREELGAYELHSDPVALAAAGPGLHVFARSYVGDLLHFRLRRGWGVTNRTDHRRAGPRFRLEGDPVPFSLPRGGTGVVARGRDGALVSYIATPLKGWWADEVPAAGGAGLADDPVVACDGAEVHALARGRNGHLLHFHRAEAGWSAGDLTRTVDGVQRVAGAPSAVFVEDRLHVFARTREGQLLRATRGEDGDWSAELVSVEITGDPVAVVGPAGIHVFAAGEAGLMHAWSASGQWAGEDVSATRPDLPRLRPGERILAWGAADELRVLSRGEAGLQEWVWRPSSDWVAAPLAERSGVASRHIPGDDPVLADLDAPHIFATDGAGTLVHFEPGDHGPQPELAAPPSAPIAVPTRTRTPAIEAALARKSAEEEAFADAEPLPLLDDPEPEGDGSADEDPAPLPLLEPLQPEPEAADEAEPMPWEEEDGGTGPANTASGAATDDGAPAAHDGAPVTSDPDAGPDEADDSDGWEPLDLDELLAEAEEHTDQADGGEARDEAAALEPTELDVGVAEDHNAPPAADAGDGEWEPLDLEEWPQPAPRPGNNKGWPGEA